MNLVRSSLCSCSIVLICRSNSSFWLSKADIRCCNSSLSSFNLLLPKREPTFATNAAFSSVLAASCFSDLTSCLTSSSCCSACCCYVYNCCHWLQVHPSAVSNHGSIGLLSYAALLSHVHHVFTVGYTQVMFDDLSLDIIKHKIGFPRFHTLALCLVPFGIPKLFRDSPLATELCYRSVDCNSSHDGDNSILFLTVVHVEQHLECASCHTRFFLVAKL